MGIWGFGFGVPCLAPWHLQNAAPAPNQPPNPCRPGRQAARGGQPAGSGQAGGRHTHPPSPSFPLGVCSGKTSALDSTVPSKRSDAPLILHPSRAPTWFTSTSPTVLSTGVSQAGSGIWHLLHLQLQLQPPGSLGFDTHFPAAATPVLSTKIVVNIKYHSICMVIQVLRK